MGADPLGDFPDRRPGRARPSTAADFVVAVDGFLSAVGGAADVVLPAAIAHERTGTTTNIEGRVTRLAQKLVAPGQCWPDWMIAAELADRLGGDLGVSSAAELWDEIERLAPSHAGITRAVLDAPAARDGIVAPLPASPVRITEAPTSPAPFDPMATPGHRVGRGPGGAAAGRAGRAALARATSASTSPSGAGGANGRTVAGDGPGRLRWPVARRRPHAARRPTATRCGWCRRAALRPRCAARARVDSLGRAGARGAGCGPIPTTSTSSGSATGGAGPGPLRARRRRCSTPCADAAVPRGRGLRSTSTSPAGRRRSAGTDGGRRP